jgi:phosphatidylserine decarboxylase
VSECVTEPFDCMSKPCAIHLKRNEVYVGQQKQTATQRPQSYEKDDNVNKGVPIAYAPVVQELQDAIESNSWRDIFQEVIESAQTHNIPKITSYRTVDSCFSYLNSLLRWCPSADLTGCDIVYRLFILYFVLNQPSLSAFQTPICRSSIHKPLSWLSTWLIRYAQAMETFLDSSNSIFSETVESFKKCKCYDMHNYIEPNGGWRTFDMFFAWNFKPGYRPITAPVDPSIIVSPADCSFSEQWPIDTDSKVVLKNIP